MALRTLARRYIGRVFHRLRPYKHIENSPTGVRLAEHGGFKSIDIDLHMTRDGIVVACHDGHPLKYGFFDPLHRIGRNAAISELTWAQVSRLRNRTGARVYRIHRIEQMLRVCHRQRRVALLEPKADKRFAQDWVWQYIAECAEEAGTVVSVRALTSLGGAAYVAAAERAGFKAWTI